MHFYYYSQGSSLCCLLALFTLLLVCVCVCLCMCEYSLSSCVCTRVGRLRGPSPGVVKQRVEPQYQVNFLRPLTNPVWRELGQSGVMVTIITSSGVCSGHTSSCGKLEKLSLVTAIIVNESNVSPAGHPRTRNVHQSYISTIFVIYFDSAAPGYWIHYWERIYERKLICTTVWDTVDLFKLE